MALILVELRPIPCSLQLSLKKLASRMRVKDRTQLNSEHSLVGYYGKGLKVRTTVDLPSDFSLRNRDEVIAQS